MKESEAREKWCPFVQYHSVCDDSSSNRCSNFATQLGGAMDASNCIGSKCVAWQLEWRGLGGEETTDGYCGIMGDRG